MAVSPNHDKMISFKTDTIEIRYSENGVEKNGQRVIMDGWWRAIENLTFVTRSY